MRSSYLSPASDGTLFVALLCTFSSSASFQVYGTSLMQRTPGGIKSSFCTMFYTFLHLCIGMFYSKPAIWFPFLAIFVMWYSKLSSLSTYTPRSFSQNYFSSLTSSFPCFMWYSKSGCPWPALSTIHFFGWKLSCHFFADTWRPEMS